MAFNQRLIVVQTPINAREKRKRKKRSFAHFVFNFCSFRFCDYTLAKCSLNKVGEKDERWRSITFMVDRPQDIYVGWQASLNLGGETQEFRVKEVQLLYSPKQGGDAVSSAKTGFVSEEGRLYNLKGQKLSKEPHRGIYIKNGRKILK